MTPLWSRDDGLTNVTAAFQGLSQPLSEILDDIHRRGWTVGKISVKDDQYVAEGKNPHGESLEATGRTDATAAGNLLVRIMRREFMRASAVRTKLGAWDAQVFEQQFSPIAQAYAGAPVYDPKASTAWMELAQDCGRRAAIVRQQIVVEYTDDPVPYDSADEMREDVGKKRHIWITRAYPHHPVWSQQQMLDYRLIVDVLGHMVGGGDWGWHGSCLAFASLAPLFADAPQKAVFTELLGQTAFGMFYRQWGPQKICFLDDLIEPAQQKGNTPGHTGVHPSQSIVPTVLPRIGAAVTEFTKDPNADWESGVQPLPDNAYSWQRQEGIDPLDSQTVTDSLRPLDTGISRMHPEMAKQAVINALRSSLLGSRSNPRGHAVHYQHVMGIPADVDDPIAYWDALEQQREHWNQAKGYAPGSHKQYWPEEQQLKQWIKASNPKLDDGEVQRAAKRELLHMTTEEEERILAQDQGELLPAEVVEHETYEALRRRLKALTKPTVDQNVDFGEHRLYHEAATQDDVPTFDFYHFAPTEERARIQQHGLQASNPALRNSWLTDGDVAPPTGVYVNSEPRSQGRMLQRDVLNDRPHDIWRVRVPVPDIEANGVPWSSDPHSEGFVLSQTVPSEWLTLHQPWEGGLDQWPTRTATHHADMYPPYLTSRLRPMAQISRHADSLAEAAQEDFLNHKGHGHHFRNQALALNISQLGPRQLSHAWLHLAPQTSQLSVIEPQLDEVLGHNYETDMSNREYFKHERELAAGRDAAGYGHMPLGAFSTGLWEQKVGGPGWHPDRTAFKAQAPAPHHTIDWDGQAPTYPAWSDPYWWQSTQQARDQVAQDFDRSVGTGYSRDEIPYQRTSASDARSPWVTDPRTAQRVTGAPGASLMQHLKDTFGHPSATDVWAAEPEYEVGKS